MDPTIAIIGRPNVGKSSLMNRIVGYRHAIVDSTPGVTRDRNYAEAEWNGRRFLVVDTGGLDPDNHEPLMTAIRDQVEFALNESQAVIFLCDGPAGLFPDDREILRLLRKSTSQLPIFVAVNKLDNPRDETTQTEFYALGIDTLFPVSAVHGHGVAELLDAVVEVFPRTDFATEKSEGSLERIAIVGKPNVGKSSLFNRLINQQRSIVDDVPGTTRDTILFTFDRGGKTYRFIDTAGLRRPARSKDSVEHFSVMRTLGMIEKTDLAILVLDASEGRISYQDKRIAGRIVEAGCGCVILWNKWDIATHDAKTWDRLVKETRDEFPNLTFAPVLSCSAKSGLRVNKVFDLIDQVQTAGRERISPERLKSILFDAVTMQPPPSFHGNAVRISSIKQLPGPPIMFKVFCKPAEGLHFSYERYLLNHIRQEKSFDGWPVRMIVGTS